LFCSDCKKALVRVERKISEQQAQLAAILQALDRVGQTRQPEAFAERPYDQKIEIKDYDYGSTMS
jgi:hypothetical protein